MTALREYRFEFCWLVLLLVIFLLSPAPISTQEFSWEDSAEECPSIDGWCMAEAF